MNYKLGSLFDGSGGFPLAGSLCGIEPVWASEVEPYPIAVTRERFPKMKHLGDISKINGAEIEPVDIITFGSPCQDLSVAGKRAGLKHEANGDDETTRSGLFMEAVRIIKEMRKATNGQYPRFALWENVPGAFSSNKGEDFRIVCEELIKVVEPSAFMPPVPKNGWNYADSYIGDGWSLAYRVFDAQYWGVPQRRRRIHLVADFRGECAREILFEREGLRGYFAEGTTPWQATPADAQGSTGADDREGEPSSQERGLGGRGLLGGGAAGGDRGLDDVGIINTIGGNAENYHVGGPLPTLANGTVPGYHNAVAVPYTLKIRSGVSVDSNGKAAGKGALVQVDKAATLATTNDQYLFQPVTDTHILDDQGGSVMRVREDGKAPTLRAQMGGHPPVVMVPQGVDIYNFAETGDKAATLTTQGGGTASGPSVIVPVDNPKAYSFDSLASNSMKSKNPHSGCREVEVAKTLDTTDPNPSKNQGGIAVVQPVLHASKASFFTRASDGAADTLVATDYKDPQLVAYAVENHPADSRVNIDEGGKVQTLTSRMGTGGGNVPRVMMATQQGGAEIRTDGKAPTLTAAAGMSGNNQPVICLQGNGIDRADTAGCNGKGWREDAAYTLNTIDRPAVVYAVDQGGGKSGANVHEDKAPTLCTTHGGEPAVAYGLDRASFNQGQNAKFDFSIQEEQQPTLTARGPGAVCCTAGSFTQVTEEISPTLMARDWKDPTCVCTNYIVRRLTPTECARLQGFADLHGHIEQKSTLSDEEYAFWLEVRNTHAAINGKKVQDYTPKQMLTWVNKLWTDSAEYKMWGNGIALPPALYCMQGIVDALNTEEEDAWML